jgi:UDP-glucose 4-epimerase
LPATFAARPVPWGRPGDASAALQADLDRFAGTVGHGRWSLVWAAGAAVTSATVESTARELGVFTEVARAVRAGLPAGRGRVFLASSAGGVLAGASGRPPYDDETEPRALGPYGELKLAQERVAAELLADHAAVIVGRFANLYGPGQDLAKRQGLVSQLALATLLRRSLNLYVPLETARDYLYVDDAAAMVGHLLDDAAPADGPVPVGVTTRLLATGRATTVAELVALVQRIAKRRSPVAYGADPSARFQARDLRLRPRPEIRRLAATDLSAGLARVLLALRAQLQAGGAPAAFRAPA